MIYGIVSDLHFHNWSAFSHTTKEGVNSRLAASISEFKRAAQAVKDKGGDLLVITGDVFHVRGSVAPSVLNPVRDAFEHVTRNMKVVILPGNHDLEGKEATRIGNACEALRMPGVQIINEPCMWDRQFALVPWCSTVDATKTAIDKVAKEVFRAGFLKDKVDLLLHAPIDGVIAGLPPHGLTADYLRSVGFKRVFSGHYHNHKYLGGGVYSVGALTHLTWSDVGSKAGFLLVDDKDVTWGCTNAPMFTDVAEGEEWESVMERADGNFVRAKVTGKISHKHIEEFRARLLAEGALGVRVDVIRAEGRERADKLSASVTGEALTLEESIGAYITKQHGANPAVLTEALRVLAAATEGAV